MKNINRNVLIGLGVVIVLSMCYYFSSIVAYVVIAWVLSMIGQPLMRFFGKLKVGKFKVGRSLSAVFVLITYFIVIGILGGMFIPLIVKQASNLATVEFSETISAIQEPVDHVNEWLIKKGLVSDDFKIEKQLLGENFSIQTPVEDTANINSTDTTINETTTTPIQSNSKFSTLNWLTPAAISNFFTSILSVAGSVLINIFSVIFITFFFLKDDGLFLSFLQSIVPTKYEQKVKRSLADISRMLTRYFGGVLIQITIITIFVSLGLTIFGIKNALLIGFFAALINVIPYIGPIIGATFGVFITITSNIGIDFYSEMLPMLLTVVAVFGAMQLLDNFVLQPFIFSNSVMAHPLEIFIIILMGAQLNGIIGMVLAIPVYTVIRVVARSFLSEFKIVKRMTERMAEGDKEKVT